MTTNILPPKPPLDPRVRGLMREFHISAAGAQDVLRRGAAYLARVRAQIRDHRVSPATAFMLVAEEDHPGSTGCEHEVSQTGAE